MSNLKNNNAALEALIEQVKALPEAGGEDVTAEVTAQAILIDDLEAAVDALPEAGGGGIGPMCTVKIVADAPVLNTTFHYLDSNLSLVVEVKTASQITSGVTFNVPAHTPLCTWPEIATVDSGGAIKVDTYCYYITSDAVITII